MKAISVIIPAYNVQPYIRTCLDSLLGQSFDDFEIIVINDGSKDDTLSILKEYHEKHPMQVLVIDQENQGQSVARNTGIAAASGKYITFVDADDYLKNNTLQILYDKAEQTGCEVVCYNVDCVYPDKTVGIAANVTISSTALTPEDKKPLFSMYPIVCNKLFKREVFFEKGLAFEPGIWFEDVLFINLMIAKIDSITYVDDYLYEYIQRPNSVTYTYSKKLFDIHIMLHKTLAYYREHGLFDTYKDELEYMYARNMLATYIKRLSKAKDLRRFKEGIAFAAGEVKKNFPNYRKNPYVTGGGLKGLYLKHFNPLLAYVIYFIEKDRMN